MGSSNNYEYGYNESNINNEYNIDINSFSEEDKELLNLLYIQNSADVMFIVADILSYISTRESINLIYSKYAPISNRVPNPDVPAVQSLMIIIVARLIYTQIGFIRYERSYNEKINGEIEYSLKPNADINTSNIFRLVGELQGLVAAIAIYDRDLGLPIFGI